MSVVRFSELACFVIGAIFFAGCSGSDAASSVQVFAAASLTDAFTQLEAEFEAANPGVDVVVNLGGSSSLREQIRAGAPADVFASANEQTVDVLADEGLLGSEPVIFATNSLVLAVPIGNPADVVGVEDLQDDALVVGLCAPAVPCGELAIETLERIGVEASVDTNEPDVRALLTKIEIGELDAGLVYLTDALASPDGVESIGIGVQEPPVTRYPVVALADAPNPDGAEAFVDFVLSAESSGVFASLGFGAPQ